MLSTVGGLHNIHNDNAYPKVLLVANVAKEHVLKFHIPTIKLLKESGWRVDVACSGQEPIPFCNSQFRMSYKRSPFNFAIFKGIRELKTIIDREKYDLVYCHTPVGAFVARLASIDARKSGMKVVYMAHGFHFFKGAPLKNWLLFYPIEKILSYFTDGIILINQEDFQRARKHFYQQNTFLLDGIGVDFSRFQKIDVPQVRKSYREELSIPQDAIILIYLAELIPNKNQKLLMRVLKELLHHDGNVYLVLAGVDHTDGTFINYAKKLGIGDHLRYLGWRSDVANLYAMADICVASSIREGFGVNIIEAMASGLPVVATDNRGHRTIIRDGENGFLVPYQDEALYAKRVAELIADCQLRERITSSAKKDLEKYSTEVATARIKGILEDFL